ncbi:DUF3833 family protein [Algibacillus agarilyticus]|uniref:DUF3833 family protein n=1 Tax=Algibacillus agarilyticus TaxID=2234133 RepID=UPI000DCFEC6D|nr:DUF3833 family protein [Algibacillus agarilyticus]
MKFFVMRFVLLISCLSLLSCTTQLNDYQAVDKPFDVKAYFSGRVIAWGIVQDYTNHVQRRFCVEIDGSWQGNEGLLAETFYFADGEVTYRNWALIKQTNGDYQGTAEDVIGQAIGRHQGFAFQFEYQLLLQLDDDVIEVTMDDWMYQLDQYRVMNKTAMYKLGVQIAEVTLFFDKQQPVKNCGTFQS